MHQGKYQKIAKRQRHGFTERTRLIFRESPINHNSAEQKRKYESQASEESQLNIPEYGAECAAESEIAEQ